MPLLLSVAFQQLYQMADSMIVGRFAESAQAGELALAAVGASYPITQLFVAVATGINIGTSVLVSQLFGAKRYLRMKTAISTALITTTVVSLLLTLFGAVCTNGLMSALNTSADIFADASLYLRVYVFGLLFLFIYNVCTGIFNAMGDSRTPLFLLILSSVGNLIIQYYVNLCGPTVIAGFSVANRINMFALTCCMSFASGLSSYVAQNIGARKLDRVGPGLKAGGTFSVGLGIVFMMIYLPLANRIISLFLPAGSASGVVDVARGYLFTVVPFYVVVCIKFVCDSVLRGAGAMRPFMITTFSDLILRVILSIALFYVIGNEHGIWMSWPIGWFLGSGLSVFFYKTGAWRKDLPTL